MLALILGRGRVVIEPRVSALDGISDYTSFFFFFQAEDGIRDLIVTGVQTCALPISRGLRNVMAMLSLSKFYVLSDNRAALLRPGHCLGVLNASPGRDLPAASKEHTDRKSVV